MGSTGAGNSFSPICSSRLISIVRVLVERSREAVFRENSDVDPRTAVLIALAASTGILAATFGKQEVANRKDRIEHIAQGQATSAATDQATKAAMDAATSAIFLSSCVIPMLLH